MKGEIENEVMYMYMCTYEMYTTNTYMYVHHQVYNVHMYRNIM